MQVKRIPLMATVVLGLVSLTALSNAGLPWSNDDEYKPLVGKFLTQDEITYCVSLGGGNAEQANMSLNDLAEQFEIAFREWTVGVASTIENSPRAEEFKDITKLLKRNIKLVNTGECKENYVDITVRNKRLRFFTIPANRIEPDFGLFYSPDKCLPPDNVTIRSSYGSEQEPPHAFLFKEGPFSYICIRNGDWNSSRMSGPRKAFDEYRNNHKDKLECKFNTRQQTFPMILHEVGHTFGLGDEYDVTVTSSQNKTREKTYDSYTKEPGYGVMNWGTEITWDEIEGLITSIDKYNGVKRTISPTLRDIKPKKGKVPVIIDGKEVLMDFPVKQ